MRCDKCRNVIGVNDDCCSSCGSEIRKIQKINYLTYEYDKKIDEYNHNGKVKVMLCYFSIVIMLITLNLVPIVLLLFVILYYKSVKNDIDLRKKEIDDIQLENHFVVCEKCGYFKEEGKKCEFCDVYWLLIYPNKELLKKYARTQVITNIVIVLIAFFALYMYLNQPVEHGEEVGLGFAFILAYLPVTIVVSFAILVMANLIFERKKRSIRDSQILD